MSDTQKLNVESICIIDSIKGLQQKISYLEELFLAFQPFKKELQSIREQIEFSHQICDQRAEENEKVRSDLENKVIRDMNLYALIESRLSQIEEKHRSFDGKIEELNALFQEHNNKTHRLVSDISGQIPSKQDLVERNVQQNSINMHLVQSVQSHQNLLQNNLSAINQLKALIDDVQSRQNEIAVQIESAKVTKIDAFSDLWQRVEKELAIHLEKSQQKNASLETEIQHSNEWIAKIEASLCELQKNAMGQINTASMDANNSIVRSMILDNQVKTLDKKIENCLLLIKKHELS